MSESTRIHFPGAGGDRLVGIIDEPDTGAPRAQALFAHCFTCSKDLKAARWISRSLAAEGYRVLRFDFTGLGESEGDFADTNFSSNLDDLVAAADFLRDRFGAPSLLVGHSLGGAAVLAAAERIPESRAVATIGAPASTRHLLEGALSEVDPEADEQTVQLAGRSFTVRRQLLDDLAEDHLEPRLDRLGRALLVLHAPLDAIVGIDHARRLFEAAKHPKSFVSLDDADHLLTREADARYAARVLASWASRYVGAADETEEPARKGPVMDDGWLTVRSLGGGLHHEIEARDHRLDADEPTTVPGGTDRGPTPYELLLGALGACTAMTVRLYANRKEWPLESVAVRLRHGRIHAEDCGDCETTEGQIDEIALELEVGGDLDADQRSRILQIADRCPVKRTLSTETKVRSRLVGGES